MKNNQYPKDLISSANIMKKHRHDDFGTRKTEHKTSKNEIFRKQNKCVEKEEKATEEEYQASFTQKSKFREFTCYCSVNPRHIFPDCLKEAST